VRFLAIGSTEFLPSMGRTRAAPPEVLDLAENLEHLGLTREQLIDVAILVGTDFNQGVKGIGPRTAVRRIREWKSLDHAPAEVTARLPSTVDAIRQFFSNPPVSTEPIPAPKPAEPSALYRFLCEERGFARDRVERAIERLHRATGQQTTLDI